MKSDFVSMQSYLSTEFVLELNSELANKLGDFQYSAPSTHIELTNQACLKGQV